MYVSVHFIADIAVTVSGSACLIGFVLDPFLQRPGGDSYRIPPPKNRQDGVSQVQITPEP